MRCWALRTPVLWRSTIWLTSLIHPERPQLPEVCCTYAVVRKLVMRCLLFACLLLGALPSFALDRFQVEGYTLPNGLQLVLKPGTERGHVAIRLVVGVGLDDF